MRVSAREMEDNHRRIVAGAARLFRERGVRSTSVADAMKAADMTHGGFYRHFDSKDALLAAAIRAAFEDFAAPLEQRQRLEPPARVAAEFKAQYLSHAHRAHPGKGCPMPALAGELAQADAAVKAAFGEGVARMVAALAATEGGNATAQRQAALRQVAMMVGAVALARACDDALAEELLAACR